MRPVHAILAYATVLAVGVALVWTLILAVTERSGGRVYDCVQTVVVVLIVLAATAGAAHGRTDRLRRSGQSTDRDGPPTSPAVQSR